MGRFWSRNAPKDGDDQALTGKTEKVETAPRRRCWYSWNQRRSCILPRMMFWTLVWALLGAVPAAAGAYMRYFLENGVRETDLIGIGLMVFGAGIALIGGCVTALVRTKPPAGWYRDQTEKAELARKRELEKHREMV
jgi:hypothetical protein